MEMSPVCVFPIEEGMNVRHQQYSSIKAVVVKVMASHVTIQVAGGVPVTMNKEQLFQHYQPADV